jgi:hypothetical protein
MLAPPVFTGADQVNVTLVLFVFAQSLVKLVGASGTVASIGIETPVLIPDEAESPIELKAITLV